MSQHLAMTEIHNATDFHLPIIRSIAYRTWPETFESILSPEQIMYMLEQMYSIDSLKAQVGEKGHQFILAKSGQEYLGFAGIELNYAAASQTKIHKIYILPEAQGKGIGKALFAEITQRAKQAGNQKLLLNVNRHNKAVHFYENIGFSIANTEDIDIGNGFFMNDYVMEKSIL